MSRRLIDRSNTGSNSHSVLSMHRSLKFSLLNKLRSTSKYGEDVFESAVKLIKRVTPKHSELLSPTEQWHAFELSSPHILSLLSAYDHSMDRSRSFAPSIELDFAGLLADLGTYMWERSLQAHALRVLDSAENICFQLRALASAQYDPVDIDLQILFLRSSFELNHGCDKRREGLENKKKMVELQQARVEAMLGISTKKMPCNEEQLAVLRKQELKLSTFFNDLGCAYVQFEDYETAHPLFERALQMKRKYGNDGNEELASGLAEEYKNLSLVAISRGQTKNAYRWSDRAVEVMRRRYGSHTQPHIHTLFHEFIRASIHFNAGEHDRAFKENKDILDGRRQRLRPSNGWLLDSYYAVAMMQELKGDLENAE